MKHKSISRSLVEVRTSAKRTMMVLLLEFATLSLAVGGMSLTATAQVASSTSVGAEDSIQGSWILRITDPPGGRPPFTGIASFSAGGVFTATGERDRGVDPVSELHGTWERISGNRYGKTAYLFAFDPAGIPVGLLQTNFVYKLTGKNTLVGVADTYFCNLQGDNCFLLPGVSTVTGKRMIVKDLPAF